MYPENVCVGVITLVIPHRCVMCEKKIRQPFGKEIVCNTTTDGESCAAYNLIKTLESKHLSRVAMQGQSRYSVNKVAHSHHETSLQSTDVTKGKMKVVSHNITLNFCGEDN